MWGEKPLTSQMKVLYLTLIKDQCTTHLYLLQYHFIMIHTFYSYHYQNCMLNSVKGLIILWISANSHDCLIWGAFDGHMITLDVSSLVLKLAYDNKLAYVARYFCCSGQSLTHFQKWMINWGKLVWAALVFLRKQL